MSRIISADVDKWSGNLEKCLVEDLLVLLAVLPEDELAEVRVVDEAVDADLVGHVDHLLLPGVQTQGLHSVQSILCGELYPE